MNYILFFLLSIYVEGIKCILIPHEFNIFDGVSISPTVVRIRHDSIQ